MILTEQDAFAIRNQGPGGPVELEADLESVAMVCEELERGEVANRAYLSDAAGFILYRIAQALADVQARVTANEAVVREKADRALDALSNLIKAIAPAEGGRLFHSLANAIAIREGGENAGVSILGGIAADDLTARLAELDTLRTGLTDVLAAYTKPGRKGGPDPKDVEFHALLEVAKAYRGVTGSWPVIRTGGDGEGVTGHFYSVVSIACAEVGAMTPAGRPLFTEAVYRRVREAIAART